MAEMGWCEAGDHESEHDETHGYTMLHDPTTTWSFCDDEGHEQKAARDIAEMALREMSLSEALAAVDREYGRHYEEDFAVRLRAHLISIDTQRRGADT